MSSAPPPNLWSSFVRSSKTTKSVNHEKGYLGQPRPLPCLKGYLGQPRGQPGESKRASSFLLRRGPYPAAPKVSTSGVHSLYRTKKRHFL